MAMGKGGGLMALGLGKMGMGAGEGEDEALDAKTSAMRDLKEALDAGDFRGAAMAFKDAYDACAMSGPEEPEGDEYPQE